MDPERAASAGAAPRRAPGRRDMAVREVRRSRVGPGPAGGERSRWLVAVGLRLIAHRGAGQTSAGLHGIAPPDGRCPHPNGRGLRTRSPPPRAAVPGPGRSRAATPRLGLRQAGPCLAGTRPGGAGRRVRAGRARAGRARSHPARAALARARRAGTSRVPTAAWVRPTGSPPTAGPFLLDPAPLDPADGRTARPVPVGLPVDRCGLVDRPPPGPTGAAAPARTGTSREARRPDGEGQPREGAARAQGARKGGRRGRTAPSGPLRPPKAGVA